MCRAYISEIIFSCNIKMLNFLLLSMMESITYLGLPLVNDYLISLNNEILIYIIKYFKIFFDVM